MSALASSEIHVHNGEVGAKTALNFCFENKNLEKKGGEIRQGSNAPLFLLFEILFFINFYEHRTKTHYRFF